MHTRRPSGPGATQNGDSPWDRCVSSPAANSAALSPLWGIWEPVWGWENPSGFGEKDKSALASPSIILTYRKSQTLSTEPHFSSSCALINTLQKKLAGFFPVASAFADRKPALFKTHFHSNTILRFLSLAVSSRCNDKRVHRMAAVMVLWWVLAISSWISDRWLCGLWQAINFPYFHSFW